MSYNGWKNYETWCVSLWLDNDPNTHAELLELVQVDEDEEDREKELWLRAQMLEKWVEEMNPVSEASLWSDLLSAALSEVDWAEIVENHQD
jgi:hypothetical protein